VAQAFYVPVSLIRANRNVYWGNDPSFSLIENSYGITFSTQIATAVDLDEEQDVAFTVVDTKLISCYCISAEYKVSNIFSVPSGLFIPVIIPATSSIIDYATGKSSIVNATRSVRIGLGMDALDIDEAAAACGMPIFCHAEFLSYCTFSITILAKDNGNPTPSHSLLPLQPPTTATKTFKLTISRDTANASPQIKSISGLPPLGLSTGGGDIIDFIGSGLGLPFGPTSNVSLVFYNNITPFPLVNCSVITRLTRIRCVTSPGYGTITSLILYIGSFSWSSTQYPSLFSSLLPKFQQPRVLAAIDSLGIVSWHAMLSSPEPFAPNLTASLLQTSSNFSSSFALRPSNVTLLIDATSQYLFSMGTSVSVWAALSMDFGAILPLGSCAPTTNPKVSSANYNTFSSASFNFSTVLRSASWFDCPFPSISAASFRGFIVRVNYTSRSSFTPGFTPYWSANTPSLFSPSGAWWGNFTASTPDEASLLPRTSPSIISVAQDSPGSYFIINGANLGSVDLAWHSDRVEYALVDESGAPTGTCASELSQTIRMNSCAIHRGVGCRYLVGQHSRVLCNLEVGGWGSGFRVRVIVGGQTSFWSSNSISYAPPTLTGLSVPGILGAVSTTVSVLEPLGGGLLVLHGENLWPPYALVITVGGVRVYPINSRPLNTLGPFFSSCGGLNCSSGATGTYCGSSSTLPLGCFGGSGLQQWSANSLPEALNSSGNAVVVTYPPGVGQVTVDVSSGSTTSSMGISYGSPILRGVVASVAGALNGSYTLTLSASRLSPCVFCRDANNSLLFYSASPKYTCSISQGSISTSSYDATSIPLPIKGSLEGNLPSPIPSSVNSSLSLSLCALPSQLWTWGAGLPDVRTRTLIGFPDPRLSPSSLVVSKVALNTYLEGDTIDVGPVILNGTAVNIELLYTALGGETLDGGTGGGMGGNKSNTLSVVPNDLKSVAPLIKGVTPSVWLTDFSVVSTKTVRLEVDNTGPFGLVLVYPSYQSNTAQSVWKGGPIICPMTPSTTLTLTSADGSVASYDTVSSVQTQNLVPPPLNKDDPRVFLDASSDALSWVTSSSDLPCSITSWEGSKTVTGDPLPSLFIEITMPAWVGLVAVKVYTKGTLSPGAAVQYPSPFIKGISPSFGLSNGGAFVTINGGNFGIAGSLGAIWNLTGAAAINAAIKNTTSFRGSRFFGEWSPNVGYHDYPHSVYFSYAVNPQAGSKFWRYCTSVPGNNTNVFLPHLERHFL
jgi:hypothetical protein